MSRIAFSIIVLLIGLTSCHIPSTVTLGGQGGRTSYNTALQVTNNQQMLLNLVRLRYLDIPFFLDVANITTQFTYRSSATPIFPIPGFDKDNPFTLGGEFFWQSQPTLQFVPLEGQAFARQILNSIDLHTIQQLIYSGWDVDRVLRVVIQNFDDLPNAPEASGPLPELVPKHKQFLEASQLLRYFQMRGSLQVGVRVEKKKKNDEKIYTMQIAFPDEGAEAEKLSKLLSGSRTINGNFVLNMELGFNLRGRIGVMPRSILSCMYYLSESVELPKEDVDKGIVHVTRGPEGELFDWKQVLHELMQIKSSPVEPRDAYIKVKYRNHWFYIDNTDLESKKTFVLLLQLYNFQAGQASKSPPPVLTLPLG